MDQYKRGGVPGSERRVVFPTIGEIPVDSATRQAVNELQADTIGYATSVGTWQPLDRAGPNRDTTVRDGREPWGDWAAH